MMIIEGAIVL